MTEENTNLEAVGTQPATKRRTRKSSGARATQKRGARKPRVSENGAAPPTEEVTPKAETPPPPIECDGTCHQRSTIG